MNRDGFEVFSPLKGMLVPIEQAPDPVFAEKYMGDGVAIIPEDDNLYAPFSGIIKNINQNLHAVIMETDGIEILIHVGVDTVNLKGKGFKVFKKNGEKVEKGDKILEFDREFISKNAPSNMVIMVLVSPEAATLSKENSKRVNCGDYIFSVPAGQNNKRKSESGAENAQDDKYISAEAEIYNQHGIHARPAAVIASIANKASSKVLIVKGKEEANAKNVIEIMGLNLAKGDKIKIVGYGSNAKNITEEILSEIKSGLNEKASVSSPPKVEGSAQDTTINLDMTKEQKLSARPLVKGKVLGKTHLYVREEFTFEENSANKNKEKQILNAALEKTRTDMENIVNAAKNSSEKHILAAHLIILKDSSIFEVVNKLIDEGKTTLFALNKAVENSACVLKKTNNPLLIERINDLMDVKRRLIEAVIGQDSIKDIPQNSIILAKDLLPSDIKVIEARAGGVILAEGSATSHSAIMLKNTGIPAVFGAGGGILKVKNGTDVLIDTKESRVIFNLSHALKQKAEKEAREEKKLSEKYNREISLPAKTKDGIIIKITSNISGEEQSAKSLSNGADGIGLLRTEFMFAGRRIPPGEQEQAALYQNVLNNVKGKPVTIRTIDVGGDKSIAYINISAEENPVLGVRGMRVYRENESLIRTQLRALLKVKPLSSLKIMTPMITFTEEFLYVKNILNEEKHNLGIGERVSLGMMIETPAAALNVRAFCKDADFFSLGTNDLSQYTLAIDRGHLSLANQIDAFHPSILKLMKTAAEDAKAFNKPISVCGAMASETHSLPLLVGMGIDELAITTAQIPEAKYIIRRLDAKQCGDFVPAALEKHSASEVRLLIKQTFGL